MVSALLKERLDSFYIKGDSCWECFKGLNYTGYASINIKGKKQLVHRLMYELHNGSFDKSLLVCHTCDNPKCVNPEHLFLGTYSDNALDRESKGRGRDSKGEQNGRNKLETSQVLEIASSPLPSRKLASLYGVEKTIILDIKNKKSWKHLWEGAAL